MVSKLWDAATRGSKINDCPCAAFWALTFNDFVELAAICDNCAAREEAILTPRMSKENYGLSWALHCSHVARPNLSGNFFDMELLENLLPR
jgi:hypothetical protein